MRVAASARQYCVFLSFLFLVFFWWSSVQSLSIQVPDLQGPRDFSLFRRSTGNRGEAPANHRGSKRCDSPHPETMKTRISFAF